MAETTTSTNSTACDDRDTPDGASQIHSIHTLFLEKPPCCIEFSPIFRDYFIVGTYNLVDDRKEATADAEARAQPQQRDGSLILCRIKGDEIHIIQTLPVPFGVLDIHFSTSHPSILAAATSTGSIATYLLPPATSTSLTPSVSPSHLASSPSAHLQLTHIGTLQAFDTSTIVTSLSWFASPTPTDSTNEATLAVTLTTGEVGILTLPSSLLATTAPTEPITVEDGDFEVLYTHSLEAWITAVLPPEWPHSGVLSGGDDAVLAYAPLPPGADLIESAPTDAESSSAQMPMSAWSNKRIHEAGVTAIFPISIPHPSDNTAAKHVYLTGSYDDTLRILSVPDGIAVRQPQVLHEIGLGGGVWRIKVLRSSTRECKGEDVAEGVGGIGEGSWEYNAMLLVSCMYAGAKVVEVRGIASPASGDGEAEWIWEWTCREVGWMEEHESMCYACDVQGEDDGKDGSGGGGGKRSGDRMVVSCSFYDKRLCLWKWPGGAA